MQMQNIFYSIYFILVKLAVILVLRMYFLLIEIIYSCLRARSAVPTQSEPCILVMIS